MRNFQGIFLIIYTYIFISKFKTDQWFSFMKLETFTNCKDGKYVIIMIFFWSYVILVKSWKLLSENPQLLGPILNPPPLPLRKSTPSFLLTPPKNSKSANPPPPPPPFCQHWKFFRPLAEWGENMVTLVVWYWRYAN